MATALAEGVLAVGVCQPGDLRFHDCNPAATAALAKKTGGTVVDGKETLAAQAEALLLCVKPADALDALGGLQAALAGKTVISIAAGVPLAQLEKAAGPGVRVIRVMPNTPALLGRGAAAFARGSSATDEDAARTTKIFSAVGTVAEVKEPLLDAVTGLSGSGPAYFYLIIEALADGGVRMGLPRDLALQLAAQTAAGAAAMVRETGLHPAVLKDQVTSPGGTTLAGLERLEAAAVRAALIGAVRAATERSKELGAR